MSGNEFSALMRRGLALAETGRYGASPNPMVGAVILDREGAVAGEGAHMVCGGPHAEIVALREAKEKARGGTLVVTLEPCAHHGRTPPCVDAIVAAGVTRVVIGMRDPNPAVDGAGVAALAAHGIEVIEAIESEACAHLNRRFVHWKQSGMPWVTLKLAMTCDGKLAARGGRRQAVSGPEARRAGYALREEHDAVLVGVGTVLADDPRLGRHLGLNPAPSVCRVVLDSRLRTPVTCALLAERPETAVVFCAPGANAGRRALLEKAGAVVLEVAADESGRCDARAALKLLSERGMSSVLVEGGGETHFSFFRAALAQELVAFVAPTVLGGREAVPAVGGAGFSSPATGARLRFRIVERVGEDVMITAEIAGV